SLPTGISESNSTTLRPSMDHGRHTPGNQEIPHRKSAASSFSSLGPRASGSPLQVKSPAQGGISALISASHGALPLHSLPAQAITGAVNLEQAASAAENAF